jgi:hypothetical protein
VKSRVGLPFGAGHVAKEFDIVEGEKFATARARDLVPHLDLELRGY